LNPVGIVGGASSSSSFYAPPEFERERERKKEKKRERNKERECVLARRRQSYLDSMKKTRKLFLRNEKTHLIIAIARPLLIAQYARRSKASHRFIVVSLDSDQFKTGINWKRAA
jgi:hypothetical protein